MRWPAMSGSIRRTSCSVRQVHGAGVAAASSDRPRRLVRARSRRHRQRRSIGGDLGSRGRLRSDPARRRHGRRRGGHPRGLARHGEARRDRGDRCDAGAVRRQARTAHRRGRSVHWPMLLRSGRRCAGRIPGGGPPPSDPCRLVFDAGSRQAEAGPVARHARSARGRRPATAEYPYFGAVHEDLRRCAALISGRGKSGGPDGRRYSAFFNRASASSIPRFESRSASLLNSRRTCSNFTSSSSATRRRART